MSGKQPKNLNAKMKHFTFVDTYYKAIKLMTEAESGQYVKAICEYMFNGTERKLKPPVDVTELELVRVWCCEQVGSNRHTRFN